MLIRPTRNINNYANIVHRSHINRPIMDCWLITCNVWFCVCFVRIYSNKMNDVELPCCCLHPLSDLAMLFLASRNFGRQNIRSPLWILFYLFIWSGQMAHVYMYNVPDCTQTVKCSINSVGLYHLKYAYGWSDYRVVYILRQQWHYSPFSAVHSIFFFLPYSLTIVSHFSFPFASPSCHGAAPWNQPEVWSSVVSYSSDEAPPMQIL